MKSVMSDMKKPLDGINDSSEPKELKISESKDTATETIQNETHREKPSKT